MQTHASRGLTAGFIAAAALIVWIVVIDVVQGQPLATPAYLAGLVFSFTTALPATARLLGWVILVFLVLGISGMVVARVVSRVARGATWLIGIAAGLVLAAAAAVVSAVIYRVNLVQAIGWLQLAGGGVIAGVTIVFFSWLGLHRTNSHRNLASPPSEKEIGE